MVTSILLGALMGVVAGVGGWLKSVDRRSGSREVFDFNRVVPIIVVGATVGAYSGWHGDSLASVETNVRNAGVVLASDLGIKIGWRNLLPLVQNVVRHIRGI